MHFVVPMFLIYYLNNILLLIATTAVVYFPEEEKYSSTALQNIRERSLNVGDIVTVKASGKTYKAKMVATGKIAL